MGNRKLLRQKGRREAGSFVAIPHVVMDSPNYRRCSGTAIKLLFDLARQYRGNNNGDLAPSLVRDGPAHQAKAKALRELVHYGLLVHTKHGGFGMPSLYALTWQAIDDHKTKFLEVAATTKPPGEWKEIRTNFREVASKKTQGCKSAKPRVTISPLAPAVNDSNAENQSFEHKIHSIPELKISHLFRYTKRGVVRRGLKTRFGSTSRVGLLRHKVARRASINDAS